MESPNGKEKRGRLGQLEDGIKEQVANLILIIFIALLFISILILIISLLNFIVLLISNLSQSLS